MKKLLNIFATANIYLGIALLIIPLVFLVLTGINNNGYNTVSANEQPSEILSEDVVDPNYTPNNSVVQSEQILVPTGKAVTYGDKISIPSTGMDALIYECADSVCGLDAGVWRLPDYGTPINTGSPIVLAAHRWGMDYYSTSYRTKNLFYSLDKVYVGDEIDLTWNNQVYKYQVDFTEVSSHITKNDDLILVTCEYYNSPLRIIVYAKKIS